MSLIQGVQKILPDSKVKNIFLTLSANMTNRSQLGYCVRIDCTLCSVHFLLREQDSFSSLSDTTRKTTGCSLNIVFFLKNLVIFLNSASSAAALVFYLPSVCTHTDIKGKQRKVRVWNILKS